MIQELRKQEKKLQDRDYYLELIGTFSSVFSLIILGVCIGSARNDKETFNSSTVVLAVSSSTMIGSFLLGGINSEQLAKKSEKLRTTLLEAKITCSGCIYFSNNNLLPCAIHPISQPQHCKDKETV